MNFDEVRIENTNYCGYKCFFCPREKMDREMGFMSLEDFELAVDSIHGHSGLVDLHGFGEPLLDKLLIKKIKHLKTALPNSKSRIYTTLGSIHPNISICELVESGLDEIQISFYGVNKISYKQTHGIDKFDAALKNLKELCFLKQKKNLKIHIVVRDFPTHTEIDAPYTNEELSNWCHLLTSLPVTTISREMHNYGEGRSYNKPGSEGVCSVTWGYRKRILQITWNLDVIPCCFDSNSSIIFGNLKTSRIDEIFSSLRYANFIEAHLNNQLEKYPVCFNCERCFKS
ncbi:radical SAM/SPASM domain-containing protein [Flavobacterium coralii]|uniref:radical SAM/SPASM domain-containing protein n=1 Tax=Flavobacterium coralii TaxID=2838017 RepID=UPI001CA6A5B4|nr:radical SAM/SPASM domain-containing protein [Flavobacterium coralii]